MQQSNQEFNFSSLKSLMRVSDICNFTKSKFYNIYATSVLTEYEYKFCTHSLKSSNQNAVFIGYEVPIGCFLLVGV